MKHHETLSPSSWGKLDRCPGSAALCRKLPTRTMHNPGAERGTMIHAAALEGRGLDDLADFDRLAVDRYKGFVKETMSFQAGEKGWETLVEETLLIWGEDGLISFGTADEIWVPTPLTRGIIHIFDLKTHPTGEIPEHATTCQGIAYAIGALQRWRGAEAATFYAFAPYGSDGGTSYSFTVKRDELLQYEEWANRLNKRVQLTLSADPGRLFTQYLTPGDEQCKYCRAAGICPAINEVEQDVHRELVQREGLPPGMVRNKDDALEVQDQEALAEFYSRMELAQRALDGAKADLKRLLAEADSDYLELRERAGRREFIKMPRTKSDLPAKAARILKREDFQEATTISIAKLKKVFTNKYAKLKDISKLTAGEMFDIIMEDAIVRGDPSFSISWRKGRKQDLLNNSEA